MENQEIARSQSSVEISTNAKGDKSYKVKVYADTIEEAIALAVDADRKVREKLEVA
jgi:predicted transcriptional regulator